MTHQATTHGTIFMIAFFACILLTIFFQLMAKNKERMAMIEKGINLSDLNPKNKSRSIILKYVFLLIGLSIGVLAGYFLIEMSNIHHAAAYFSMILFFGGIGLLVYYIIDKNKNE